MIKCPNCSKAYTPVLELGEPGKVALWRHARAQGPVQLLNRGAKLIQEEWPHSTGEEREQLITGICSDKCWNNYLGPEQ